MKRAVASLIGVGTLLVVAFLPPVVAAAEDNENVHFGEHLLLLVAGLLMAFGAQVLIRRHVPRNPGQAAWGIGIIGVGLVLFLTSQLPALDGLADAVMAIHVLQHLMILASGALAGIGLVVVGSVPTASPRSR